MSEHIENIKIIKIDERKTKLKLEGERLIVSVTAEIEFEQSIKFVISN